MKTQALLVAEKSVLPILRQSITGLFKWGIADEAVVAIPSRDMSAFAEFKRSSIQVVAEDEFLEGHSLDSIGGRLGSFRDRSGWYLQQFAKLGFARVANEAHYIIWDADTVALGPIEMVRNGRTQMVIAKEFHKPYFETYERLFLTKPPLRASAISQYMRINTGCAKEMLDKIEQTHGRDWIDAILSVLPLKCSSEFSEYETYANYIHLEHPQEAEFVHRKWFRHGSDILRMDQAPSNEEIEACFKGYACVAFERRMHTGLKLKVIKAFRKLGVSS